MKESDFIRQNKEKWQEFEKALAGSDTDPSRTSKLFSQITDDLAYARTFYSNRSVRLYLNGVAGLLFNDLNKSRKKGWQDFLSFWTRDLPLTMFRARRAMLISLFVFICCFTLGVLTSMHDDTFAASILGANYVAVTEQNISKGDPMAIYKKDGELQTFVPILFNNLKVDFITFFSGIFMAVGSLVVMIANGIMVGVFQYFFIARGVFWESFLGIWTHGSLEIPTIILSGGAGLTLGRGLLFPGTHSRLQAFKVSAMQGLVIILGVVPLTFIAALVEGFLTRHTEIPDLARLIFIIMSFSLVLAYYFFYPRRVARQAADEAEEDRTLLYKGEERFDPAEIKPSGKIISETFHHFFGSAGYLAKLIFPATIIFAVIIAYNPFDLVRDFETSGFTATKLTSFSDFPALLLLCALFVGFLCAGTAVHLRGKLTGEQEIFWPLLHGAVTAASGTALLASLFLLEFDLALFFAILLFPFVLFTGTVSALRGLPVHKAAGAAGSLSSQSPGKLMLVLLSFAFISTVVYVACHQGLNLLFLNDALSWILTNDDATGERIEIGFFAFQTLLSFAIFVVLGTACSVLLTYSLHEAGTAEGLLKKIRAL